MEVVSLKTPDGRTIEVKRGPEGEILVRHSDLCPDFFGVFTSLGKLFEQPGAWEFLAKKGLYTNSEYGEQAMAALRQMYVLRTGTEDLFVSEEDCERIESAFDQLAS